VRVSYSRIEEAAHASQIVHPVVRESLAWLGIERGIEITSIADIPAKGTGLGSSGSFTVGLLNALHAYCGRHVSTERLADESCHIELERCGEPIGKQDPYTAAYGGINLIRFHPDETVDVKKIVLPQSGFADLCEGRIERFGGLLHDSWQLKKEMMNAMSDPTIEKAYEAARAAGAEGGKLLGAGWGGFLMFYAPPARHAAIAAELSVLRRVSFRFSHQGSNIIFVY
jgi:D-glycero-alpha-D-manno-heptose-7-phosphate kinase